MSTFAKSLGNALNHCPSTRPTQLRDAFKAATRRIRCHSEIAGSNHIRQRWPAFISVRQVFVAGSVVVADADRKTDCRASTALGRRERRP